MGWGPLLAGRLTKPSQFWVRPHRLYIKKSDYWNKPRGLDKAGKSCDNGGLEVENGG